MDTPCGMIYCILKSEVASFVLTFALRHPIFLRRFAGVAQLVERQPSKLNVASSSLVSRSKSLCRKGVSRTLNQPLGLCSRSSVVERILGKDRVSDLKIYQCLIRARKDSEPIAEITINVTVRTFCKGKPKRIENLLKNGDSG